MKIKVPTNCPSCKSELEVVNSQLFCRSNKCQAQGSKKVEAYTKGMGMKGFGPKTIQRLNLQDITQLYSDLAKDNFIDEMGEKVGTKLYNEVERTKNTTLTKFLAALSIPLIGVTAAKKVDSTVGSIQEIDEWSLTDAGLGEKARGNLLVWRTSNEDLAYGLPINLEAASSKPKVQNKGKVCITGKLNSFSNRTKAKDYLESIGYTVTSSISQKTNFLVCEDGSNSSKTRKAKQLNIQIVTIKQLEELQ